MKRAFLAGYPRDLALVALLAILCLVAVASIQNSYHLNLLTYSALYAVAALGLFLLFGYAGQISLAQGAFFGIGAYIAAYFSMRLRLPPLIGLVVAGVVPGAIAWLVAHKLLALTTNYLAMATLAFGSICYIAFGQATTLTGGLDPGIIGVPPFSLFGYDFGTPSAMFALCASALVIATLTTVHLIHSRIGRSLLALRSSEIAAAGLGIDVVRYKVAVFVIAAAMTGVAGALFAHVQKTFNASTFGVGLSIELLLMIVIGSVFTPWGAIIGAMFITIVPHALEDFEHFKLLAYGVVMTIVMIFMPDGLGKGVVDWLMLAFKKLRRA